VIRYGDRLRTAFFGVENLAKKGVFEAKIGVFGVKKG